MKSITSLLFLGAFGLSAALATPPQAARDLSIVGTLEATEEVVIAFPVLTGKVYGVGQAQHFGRYTLHMDVTVNMITSAGVGTFSIEAANGDRFTGTAAGIGTTTSEPNVFRLVELLTIQSGTGRFEGAAGTITITRLSTPATLRSSGTLKGTVTLPPNRGNQ